MGAIFNLYPAPRAPKPNGKGEVKEVMRYLGNGWYRVRCVYLDDPRQRECVRWVDIDEGKKREGGETVGR
jgi:hypothetical protein